MSIQLFCFRFCSDQVAIHGSVTGRELNWCVIPHYLMLSVKPVEVTAEHMTLSFNVTFNEHYVYLVLLTG